jgi:hypothetical protein
MTEANPWKMTFLRLRAVRVVGLQHRQFIVFWLFKRVTENTNNSGQIRNQQGCVSLISFLSSTMIVQAKEEEKKMEVPKWRIIWK